MTQGKQPRKGVLAAVFTGIGDVIIRVIQLWSILNSRHSRRIFFRNRRIKKHLAAQLKNRKDRLARRLRRSKKFSRIHILARLQRLRLNKFHRRTSPRKLLALYLVPAAVLSIGVTTFLLINNSKARTQTLPKPVLTEKEQFTKLLGRTARLLADNLPDEAQKNIEALTALAPENPTVLTHTGALLLLRKNYPAARLAYQRVLAIKPDSYIARYNLAEIEFILKNYPEAERRFLEVQRARPRDETILFRLYLCALMQNNPDADRHFQKLSPAGRTPAWQYATAARLIRENKNAEARKILDQAHILYSGKTAYYDTTFRQIGLIK
ncbi:MAG: tetratricopeptide repeat protein [Verrucomicrobiota bacterium]